jgi:hypothetical protein
MQSILTRYHSPTNTRGAKVSASGCRARVTLAWDDALSTEGNHKRAAQTLMSKLGWAGDFIGGDLPRGMVFVALDYTHTISLPQ